MDAFSVSLANGLNEPCMKKRKMFSIASIFAIFQTLMPLIGWVCVHTLVQHFQAFEKFVPWIAFGLLGFIGGKMLYEGIKNPEEEAEKQDISLKLLMVQGERLVEYDLAIHDRHRERSLIAGSTRQGLAVIGVDADMHTVGDHEDLRVNAVALEHPVDALFHTVGLSAAHGQPVAKAGGCVQKGRMIHYFLTNRTPRVPGPQWQEMVQPATES